ncbi:hypothetical protein [Archaeoglobus fulgidus]|uniref:Uncharacterized protein n=1 Tax=Archaeoglobus fulgidus TaxID=2234 RepID=A0A101E1F0_ARCFL|nr:hypothetical protein [Archaeoglobus fulgidus]KUJ94759.1 MAG: hypothetical protein XD40_0080 [Archaeoglobus fulgidus]KUK07198.1 MAG: Uncharacterized protein XD48_0560 [Archaeoglobus fulgidus]
MVVAFAFTAFFSLLTILEVLSALNIFGGEGTLMNAFVLGTITATFAKGVVVRRDSYLFVASLLAAAFSVLMILVYMASGSFSYGIFGLVTVPYLVKKARK